MKKIILTIFSLFVYHTAINAQVGIETETIAEGAILDFPSPATKGILLPKIEDKSTVGTTSGTFIFDNSSKKVAYYGDGAWIDMTDTGNDDNTPTTLYNKEELNSEGVVIEDGTGGEAPIGVLTLESNEKALALPVVEDVTSLPSPIAGTICYDKASASLAIFNGIEWHFWR